MSDTAPVRAGEELPLDRLSAWFGEAVSVEQFPGGHSNLTYLLRAASGEYVLRRAPLGPVPPKAHDMAREFSILRALHPVFPYAPRVVRLCEDADVIGAVFYVMERRVGTIFRNPLDVPDAAAARRISEAFVDCLVDLHAIDLHSSGLIAIGKPEGFLDRQVGGWSERWLRADTPDRPDAARVIDYLKTTIPASRDASVVHNDYKLDNVMLTPDLTQVAAVLDWEMTTVGDPLADLGLTLCYWTIGSAYDAPRGEGWFTREELIERYALKTGRDVSRVRWYEALGVFKLAVILQQIYVRYVRGQTADARFRDFGPRVRFLIERAEALISE
jgi:aminoglycoside phosphotransferase (APT) family kinase protein